MDFLRKLFETLANLDNEHMNTFAAYAGPWMYVVLFAILFAETGLVVTPFLPGDSLLFAVGAVAAGTNSPINLPMTALLLVIAAVLGDAVNYWVGYRVGPRVFSRDDSWLLNKKHLIEAQRFYDKYGAKTIILARFMPIVRTFAPFVAGIGKMSYPRFALYNVVGGTVWVLSFLLLGWKFGGLEQVQKNFKLVILGIIVISVLPAVYELVHAWHTARRLARMEAASGQDVIEPAVPPVDVA